MKKTLTDRTVATATSEGKPQHELFDAITTGLSIRITKDGRKTWTLTFTSPRDQKRARMTIGTYHVVTVQKARERAVELRRAIDGGKDPRDEEAAPAASTKLVRDLVDDFERLGLKGKRTAATTMRRLKKNVVAIVGDVSVRTFSASHLNKILDPINAREAPVEANRVLGIVCRLFDFALTRNEIATHPIHNAVRENLLNKEAPRTRDLSREEIVAVWNSVDRTLQKSDLVPDVLKLCLITGQRVGEVCGMARSELNLKDRLWIIPAARVKNAHDHIVPLSPMALSIIEARLNATKGEYLFPDRACQPIPVNAIDRTVARAHKRNAFGMPKWTPHDLRRTVITQMRRAGNGLGIDRFTSSLVVNHRSGTKESVTDQVYDQNDYLDEKRAALTKWATFLSALVAGDNVMPLVRAA